MGRIDKNRWTIHSRHFFFFSMINIISNFKFQTTNVLLFYFYFIFIQIILNEKSSRVYNRQVIKWIALFWTVYLNNYLDFENNSRFSPGQRQKSDHPF